MTQCDLLVIDDIDKVKQSDAFHEFLYLVVNSRYASQKPTVITTNSSFTKLEEVMGPAISSRLFAKESLLVEVEGEDLRQ
jgi:DNA replication protein DnaC